MIIYLYHSNFSVSVNIDVRSGNFDRAIGTKIKYRACNGHFTAAVHPLQTSTALQFNHIQQFNGRALYHSQRKLLTQP